MTFNTDEIAQLMHALADEAAEIARKYFNQSIGYELKADASPVTIADQEIEMALVKRIREAYPQHGIFGEETSRINPDAAFQWVIDPIDGTKAFIAGKPTFVTLIALCENGKPSLGLISQPIKAKRWLSSEVQKANAEEAASGLSDAHIATTSISYFSAPQAAAFAKLEAATSTTLLNHDGLAAGLLADGDLDILIEAKLKPYDFCALIPVIEQSGGIITDWQGNPLNMHSAGDILACSSAELHKEVLGLLHSTSHT